jgi:hypothetical protein
MRKLGSMGLIVATLAMLLGACNNVEEQKRLAKEGISQLQAAWNRGECASIYDNADGYFRRNQPRNAWLEHCSGLREQLGAWQSFDRTQGNAWPIGKVGIIWIEGSGAFANGAHTVRADFVLDKDEAKLFHLQFVLDGKLLQIPGYAGRLVD